MATKIGKLLATLGLDSRQFQKGLKDSETRSQRFGRTMRNVGRGIAASMAAATVGVGLAIRQQLNAADEMAKAAQRIGVPIEELSKLRHAANLSGASIQDLDMGVAKLGKRMAEAMGGNQGAAQIFADLGISVADASGKMRPVSDVMMDLADAVAAMPDGAAKTAASMRLLEESGLKLIPMLNQGRDGISGMMSDAEALGLVFDARTGAAAERFNDNLTRLKGAFSGLIIQLTAAFAPALAAITDGMVNAVRSFGGMQGIAQGLASVIGDLWTILRDTATGLVDLARSAVDGALGLFGVSDGANSLFAGLGNVLSRMRDMIGWLASLLRATGGWGGALEALGDVAAAVWEYIKASAKSVGPALGAVWADVKAGFVSMVVGIQQYWYKFLVGLSQSAMGIPGLDGLGGRIAGAAERVGGALDDSIGAMDRFRGEAARMRSESAGMIATGAQGVAEAVARLNSTVEEGRKATDEAAESVETLGDAFDNVGGTGAGTGGGSAGRAAKGITDVSKASEAARKEAEKSADAFASLFDGVITQGKSAKDVLRDIARQLESAGWKSLGRILFGGGSLGGGGGFGGFLTSVFGGGSLAPATRSMAGSVAAATVAPRAFAPSMSRSIAGGGAQRLHVSASIDGEGNLGVFVRDQAGQVVAAARPQMVAQSVAASQGAMRKSKRGYGL